MAACARPIAIEGAGWPLLEDPKGDWSRPPVRKTSNVQRERERERSNHGSARRKEPGSHGGHGDDAERGGVAEEHEPHEEGSR